MILTELSLIDDAVDVSFMRQDVNKVLTDRLKTLVWDVLEETDDYVLFKVGDDTGEIALIDKKSDETVYWIRFKPVQVVDITAVQLRFWRTFGSGHLLNGITKRIFLDYILKWWDVVSSEDVNSEDAKEFWLTVFARVRDTHTTGIVKDGVVDWWDRNDPYIPWIKKYQNEWRTNGETLRFLIK